MFNLNLKNMKNLDFKKSGIEVLSSDEKNKTNGGIPWLFSWRIYRPENYSYQPEMV